MSKRRDKEIINISNTKTKLLWQKFILFLTVVQVHRNSQSPSEVWVMAVCLATA